MTMRELWYAAGGRFDLHAHQVADLKRELFGVQMTPAEVEGLNPIRRRERPPPSEEDRKAEAELGWATMGAALKELANSKR